jgi:nitrous oxide reductase accessory protein NosL
MTRRIKACAVLAIALLLAGCQSVAGTPQPEPTKLDCDLIFPGPGAV